MFDSYASGGNAFATANNYLKINAVSGTLVKNHPLSVFVTADTNNTIFDPTNPRCVFPNSKTQTTSRLVYDQSNPLLVEKMDVEEQIDEEVPCVVLQSMIIGNGLFLCEIVKASDFYGIVPESDNQEKQEASL